MGDVPISTSFTSGSFYPPFRGIETLLFENVTNVGKNWVTFGGSRDWVVKPSLSSHGEKHTDIPFIFILGGEDPLKPGEGFYSSKEYDSDPRLQGPRDRSQWDSTRPPRTLPSRRGTVSDRRGTVEDVPAAPLGSLVAPGRHLPVHTHTEAEGRPVSPLPPGLTGVQSGPRVLVLVVTDVRV